MKVLERKVANLSKENLVLLHTKAELEEANFQQRKSQKTFKIVEEVCTPLQSKEPFSSLEEQAKKTLESEAVCSPLRH